MNSCTTIRSISAALARGQDSLPVAREELSSLEGAMKNLGEYPGMIGQTLLAFRRAVSLLKRAHASGDGDIITMVSAHVRELWDALSPALEKLAERGR